MPRMFCLARGFWWLAVLALGIGLAGCDRGAPEPVSLEMLSARGYYPDALELARAWRADAYLVGSNVYTREAWESRRLLVSYAFLSSSSRAEALLVLIEEDGTVSQDTVDMRGDGSDRRAIGDHQWLLDGEEAYRLAESYAGAEYRQEHGQPDVKLFLEYQKAPELPERVVWRVSYLLPMGQGGLYVEVDAATGEFVGAD